MYELQYLLFASIGFVSLLFAIGLYHWHDEVELFGAISLGCWAVLSFAGESLFTVTDAGETVAVGTSAPQYLSLGLALVSIIVIIGAWKFDWPHGAGSDKEAPV